MNVSRVLFICTGNTCRSPMAEALFTDIAQERGMEVTACSAGIMADEGLPVSLGALEAMAKRDVDVEHHRAAQLRLSHLEEADVALCMTHSHLARVREMFPEFAGKVFLLLEAALGQAVDVDDPYGGDAETYEEVAMILETAVKTLLDKI